MDESALWSSLGDPLIGSLWNMVSMSEHWNDQNWSEHQQTKQNAFAESQREGVQRYNTAEREASQAWQEYMWNQQNAYNAPIQQMQRMTAAGINPNAAAGYVAQNGTSASVPSSTAQSSSPASPGSAPGNPGFAPFGSQFGSVVEALSAARLNRSQSALNEAVARKTEEETKGIVIDNNFKPFEKQADLDQASAKIALMVQQGLLSEAQAMQINDMLPLLEGKTVAEISQIQEQCANLSAQRNQISEQIRLLSEQIETEKHRQKQMDAAAYQAYMNGLESKSAIDLNGKKMSLTEAETELKKLEKQRGDFDYGVEQDLYNRYGWKPGDKGVDRVLDTLGGSINLFENGLQSLWDNTKVQLNSLGSKGRQFLNKVSNRVRNPFNTPKKDYPLDIDDYGIPNP